jgi:sirohydrochlorin cobaltochelatase
VDTVPDAGAGLILFGHGARDPRWAEPMNRLRERLTASSAGIAVELAFLELMSPDLAQAAERLISRGCERIAIVPIFLGQGDHVRRDLASLVQQLQARHRDIEFDCAPAVGEDDRVLDVMASYCLDALHRFE